MNNMELLCLEAIKATSDLQKELVNLAESKKYEKTSKDISLLDKYYKLVFIIEMIKEEGLIDLSDDELSKLILKTNLDIKKVLPNDNKVNNVLEKDNEYYVGDEVVLININSVPSDVSNSFINYIGRKFIINKIVQGSYKLLDAETKAWFIVIVNRNNIISIKNYLKDIKQLNPGDYFKILGYNDIYMFLNADYVNDYITCVVHDDMLYDIKMREMIRMPFIDIYDKIEKILLPQSK